VDEVCFNVGLPAVDGVLGGRVEVVLLELIVVAADL
jgi:hypothetical protein